MRPIEVEIMDERSKKMSKYGGGTCCTYLAWTSVMRLQDTGGQRDRQERGGLILGYRAKSAYEIEKRLEKKGKRIEVTTQKMIRKSVRNLEKLVDGNLSGHSIRER